MVLFFCRVLKEGMGMRKLNEHGLTQQQEIFVNEYIKSSNGYQSYLIAYPKAKKWTRQTVDSACSRLLDNDKINARIKAHNDAIAKSTQESIKLNKRKILNEIIELQQQCKDAGQGQAGINLQALKLLSQIAGLLTENQNNIQVNIQNNQTVGEVTDYLDL
jgi:hypothetical protein